MGEVRAQCSEGGESVLGSESLTATDTAIVLLSASAARGDLSKVAQYWLLVPQHAHASGMGEEIQQSSLFTKFFVNTTKFFRAYGAIYGIKTERG